MRARLHITSWIASVIVLAALSLAVPASAQSVSEAEFHKLVVAPKTAADHVKLAAYYRAHAVEHETDAKLHDEIVAAASKKRDDDSWELARASAHYAEHSREAAEALRDLAKLHDGLAERFKTSK
jgi:predicted ATPase